MNAIRSAAKRHPFAAFLLFYTLLTLASLPIAFSQPDLLPLVLPVLPLFVTFSLASFLTGRAGIKELFTRLFYWRVHPIWYGMAIGIPVFGTLLMVAIAWISGSPEALNPGQLSIFLIIISYVFNSFEEISWRGFVLPKLLKRYSPLAAAIIIGFFWTLFHLPLHLPGNWYETLPIFPTFLILMGYSLIATWIFIRTNGSVLMTTLLHGTLNAITPLSGGIDLVQAWWLRGFVFLGIGLLIALAEGRRFWEKERTKLPAEAVL